MHYLYLLFLIASSWYSIRKRGMVPSQIWLATPIWSLRCIPSSESSAASCSAKISSRLSSKINLRRSQLRRLKNKHEWMRNEKSKCDKESFWYKQLSIISLDCVSVCICDTLSIKNLSAGLVLKIRQQVLCLRMTRSWVYLALHTRRHSQSSLHPLPLLESPLAMPCSESFLPGLLSFL